MEREKLKGFQGLYVTLKTDSSFIKGKLTHVDDDSLIVTDAELIKRPSFSDTYSDTLSKATWLIVNPYKVWDCCLTYEQLSNNYTISAAGVSQL